MKNIDWCIDYLKRVNDINQKINLPKERELRALMNITMPNNLSDEFYIKQDFVIKEIYDGKVVIDDTIKAAIDAYYAQYGATK